MRAARSILAEEDPNPDAAAALLATLRFKQIPVPVIQPVNDTVRLKKLRQTLESFNEKARRSRLAREARMIGSGSGSGSGDSASSSSPCRIRIVRPRAQLLGEGPKAQQAYAFFTVICDDSALGATLKAIISNKQAALGLQTLPSKHCRLFLHELAGRACSPFIGREILDERRLEEYAVSAAGYDVTVWQNQTKVEAVAAATVLLVDARPGVMLVEQADYIDECRAKEVPCYTQIS